MGHSLPLTDNNIKSVSVGPASLQTAQTPYTVYLKLDTWMVCTRGWCSRSQWTGALQLPSGPGLEWENWDVHNNPSPRNLNHLQKGGRNSAVKPKMSKKEKGLRRRRRSRCYPYWVLLHLKTCRTSALGLPSDQNKTSRVHSRKLARWRQVGLGNVVLFCSSLMHCFF